jgi:hypothetical protein
MLTELMLITMISREEMQSVLQAMRKKAAA